MATRGRKSTYTPEIVAVICERIANGEPLRQICRDDGMPGWVAVYDWMHKYPEFGEHIARARILGHEAIAQETLAIIDAEPERTAMGNIDTGHVQWSRNRVEQRLKLLAKWSPKLYGDKVETTLKGDADNPLRIERIERVIIDTNAKPTD